MARNVYGKLVAMQQQLGIDLRLSCDEIGLNIRFRKPSDEICYKYGLMAIGDQAVVFIMPDKTEELVKQFLADIHKEYIILRN